MSKHLTYDEVEKLILLAKREGCQQLTVGKFTVVMSEAKPETSAEAIGFALQPEPEQE